MRIYRNYTLFGFWSTELKAVLVGGNYFVQSRHREHTNDGFIFFDLTNVFPSSDSLFFEFWAYNQIEKWPNSNIKRTFQKRILSKVWFSGRAMLENIKLEGQTRSFFVLLHEKNIVQKIGIEIEVIGEIIIVCTVLLSGFFSSENSHQNF